MRMLILSSLLSLSLMISCAPKQTFKEQLIQTLKDNPVEVVEALQKALESSREQLRNKQMEAEQKKNEAYYDKPLSVRIRDDEAIRGEKNAPITLVMYSDFECPFCARGFNIVETLRGKFGARLRYVYKHLPLSFHEHARLAASYFEAIRMQDAKKAFDFHDLLYKNQASLKSGEPFLLNMAKKSGADIARLKKDLKSDDIAKRIREDELEANTFEFRGTPAFVLNGIPLRGALPTEEFLKVIEKLEQKGRL